MRSILVAGNDPSLKERVNQLIEKSLPEFSLLCAADEEEVFRALDDCPDIILMDSKLPDHPGYRLTNAIKSVTTQIPVIQILDQDLPESRDTAMRFGADHLLVKDRLMEARLTELLSECC